MEPIWSLLNSKAREAEWTAQHKGSLSSAIAGRQYIQTRVMRNGWATHNRCIFCLHDIVESDKKGLAAKAMLRREEFGIRWWLHLSRLREHLLAHLCIGTGVVRDIRKRGRSM